LETAKQNTARIALILNNEVKKNAWRRLTEEQHDEIAAAAKSLAPLRLTIGYDAADPEVAVFASDLIKANEDGGAVVHPSPGSRCGSTRHGWSAKSEAHRPKLPVDES
jgi:hypothetical protein